MRRYVSVEEDTGTELFYYFVESERSVGTDPLILWLTGGPRCTVFSGLAFEVGQYTGSTNFLLHISMSHTSSSCTAGPVKFVLAPYSGGLPQLVYNPLSWTKVRRSSSMMLKMIHVPHFLLSFVGLLTTTIIRWQASSSWIRPSAQVSRMRVIPKLMMSETTPLLCKSKHF
jgi:serine carboxypeptidase-like clade 1